MINRYGKTVLLLRDELPNYNFEESDFIEKVYNDAGYVVRKITVEELKTVPPRLLFGFMLVVPNCRYFPVEAVSGIKHFSENVGSVLFIGGPLCYDLVKREEDGSYKLYPLKDKLCANEVAGYPYIREGICPFYKVSKAGGVTKIKNSGSTYFNGELSLNDTRDVIIPMKLNIGEGYDTAANNRIITLADCYDNADRNDIYSLGARDGNRGSFAFISLQNTRSEGHSGNNNYNGYGNVRPTAVGSAAAHIGVSDIHKIKGADKLLTDIAKAFSRGLYLYEAGAKGIRFKKGEGVVFGANIMNTAEEYKSVTLKITAGAANNDIKLEKELLLSPHAITDVSFDFRYNEMESFGITDGADRDIVCELYDGEILVDRIDTVYSYLSERKSAKKSEFVSVSKNGEYFELDGKPWYMAGMNYWQSFWPSRELSDYWMGMYDSMNYSPSNVEQDLEYMEKCGLNCLLIRVDVTDFNRSIHGLRDFLVRCERHGFKVMLASAPTRSKYYSPKAVEQLLNNIDIAGNPTVIGLDIEWESAIHHYISESIAPEYCDEWEEWLISRFGSVENAGKALDTRFEKNAYGYAELNMFSNLKVAREYRKFVMDDINSYWAKLMKHLRPLLPDQLITFRHGSALTQDRSQAEKYIDFVPLENYTFSGISTPDGNEDLSLPGYRDKWTGLIAVSSVMHRYASGKPVVWAEYNRGLCGRIFEKGSFAYDHENMSYVAKRKENQVLYNEYVQDGAEFSRCAGTAPWWWCGGFRFTERSEYGYLMPDGRLTEAGVEYMEFCKHMKSVIGKPDEREEHRVSADIEKYIKGKCDYVIKEGIDEYIKAKNENKKLVIEF